MKMNNKGFTLVELLAVLALIAIIGLIAVPNVISLMDNSKKDLMIQDAEKYISLAKAALVNDIEFRKNESEKEKRYTLNVLDKKNTIKTDPDGGEYDVTNSYVKYTKDTSNNSGYCIYLKGSKRVIKSNTNGCVKEEELTRDNVKDINN